MPHHIHRPAVLLACIVLLGACTRQLPPPPANPARSDPLVLAAVLEHLRSVPALTLEHVEVSVELGIVDLDGYVMSQAEIGRIGRAVREVDGVRAVRNTLRVPSSGTGIRSGGF